MNPNNSFPATWGSIFNLSNGAIQIESDHFVLMPNALLTGMSFSVGKKAYTSQQYPIMDICGYSKVFMAWMKIHFANGFVLKVALAPQVKRNFIAALEEQRHQLFARQGMQAPPLQCSI